MPIYALNGTLIADGNALRGCCCNPYPPPPGDECAVVVIDLETSYQDIKPGSSTGSGSHASLAEVYSVVCPTALQASRNGSTWSEFTLSSSAVELYCRVAGCGNVRAVAYNKGNWMTLRIPYARGNAKTAVGFLRFVSTKVVAAGYTNTIKWSASIRYYSQGGGAVTPQTMTPDVSIEFTTGEVLTASGTDRTYTDFKTSSASGGQTLQDFDATVYFT